MEHLHTAPATNSVPSAGWTTLARAHARSHPGVALGLGFSLLGVLALLLQSLWQIAQGDAAPGLRLALLGGAAGFATTAMGAMPAATLGLMAGFALMMVLDTTMG